MAVTGRDRPEHQEIRILRRLAAGQRYADIAAAEYLSIRTVQRLVGDLKRQTGASSLPALCVEAARRGWLKGPVRSGDTNDLQRWRRYGAMALWPS